MADFEGKGIIVTGANRGIGRKLVESFACAGADIWACARCYSAEFEADMSALAEQYKVEIKPIYFDLRSEEQIKAGMNQIFAEKKSIDILINNAGVAAGGLMTMTPLATLREVFEINYFSQILLMQLVSRKMIRQHSGVIVNMASVAGLEHRPGYLAYGSSKAALIWMTQMAAKELGEYGIRVNAVAPANVDTDMGHFNDDEELQKVLDQTPLKRLASTEEIAKAVMFLASSGASFITGEVMRVDGGRL